MSFTSKQQNENFSKERVKCRFNELSLFKINKKNIKTAMFTANIGSIGNVHVIFMISVVCGIVKWFFMIFMACSTVFVNSCISNFSGINQCHSVCLQFGKIHTFIRDNNGLFIPFAFYMFLVIFLNILISSHYWREEARTSVFIAMR